ncbi:MAG: MBL fold metallo-hydrolase [Patescibacteria group bacterium]
MFIHFIGLSCFLIENAQGYRILVDPFSNDPQYSLGPQFPDEFNGKAFGANIVLSSEPDADHSYAPGSWLYHAPPTQTHSNPFPDLNLRGTVIYEWAGDVNIAWHYTVDGVRLAHFADNAHVLTHEQCKEIGHPDVVFLPLPKSDSLAPGVLDKTKKNIKLLNPKIVICAHHTVPPGTPFSAPVETIRAFFQNYYKKLEGKNIFYKNEESLMPLVYVLENAINLTKEYPSLILDTPTLEVTPSLLKRKNGDPLVVLFRTMIAKG